MRHAWTAIAFGSFAAAHGIRSCALATPAGPAGPEAARAALLARLEALRARSVALAGRLG